MIRETVRQVAEKLEHLNQYDIPLERSFDLLGSRARSVEELVVIEVMRESLQEVRAQMAARYQADSSSRSARMSAMALRR